MLLPTPTVAGGDGGHGRAGLTPRVDPGQAPAAALVPLSSPPHPPRSPQELEAIKARVREMEEEAEKLKELQNEVEKQMNMSPPPGNG